MEKKEVCIKCQNVLPKPDAKWANRSGRKFCSDKCRAAYHNSFIVRLPESTKPEQRQAVLNLVAEIEKSNRAIRFSPSAVN